MTRVPIETSWATAGRVGSPKPTMRARPQGEEPIRALLPPSQVTLVTANDAGDPGTPIITTVTVA